MFKITAEEKRLILRRRAQSGRGMVEAIDDVFNKINAQIVKLSDYDRGIKNEYGAGPGNKFIQRLRSIRKEYNRVQDTLSNLIMDMNLTS